MSASFKLKDGLARVRIPRLARRLLFAIIAGYCVYLIAGNIFLNTSLADAAINRKPDRFHIQWDNAWTFWPGRVRAHGVIAKGHVRRVQWQAQAATASARIAIWPLTGRELRIDLIEAERVQFDADRVEKDMLPPEAREGAWAIHLPAIRSDSLQRARWGDIELSGIAAVQFGIWKQFRGGPVEVLPSTLRVKDASISMGDEKWLQKVNLDAGFALARHRSSEVPGLEKLKLATLSLKLDADAPSLSGALGADDWMRLDVQPGGGRIAVDLSLAQAQLQRGGTLHLELPLRYTDADGKQRDNALTVDASVDDGVSLQANLPQQPEGVGSLAADLRLSTTAWPTDGIRSLLPKLDGNVALDWRFESLSWLSGALIRNNWLSFDGAGQVIAQVNIVSGKLAVGSRVEVPQVEMSTHLLQDHIRGKAHATGELLAAPDGSTQARFDVDVEQFEIAAEQSPDKVYVCGTDLQLDLTAAGDLTQMRDSFSGRLRFSNAEVPNLTAYNQYFPQRNLAFTGGSGRVSADLNLDAEGLVANGRIRLNAKRAVLRFSDLTLRADVNVDARLQRTGEIRHFNLANTTISLDRVGYAHGDERADGWWAHITLPRSDIHWERPFKLDGEASVRTKDVGFLLALFAQKKKFPKWVSGLVDAGEASVSGKAQLRGDVLVLDQLQASNDRFRAQARLRLHDKAREGDLLLGWKKLDVGLELRDTERKWHLLRAREWFDQGKAYLAAPVR